MARISISLLVLAAVVSGQALVLPPGPAVPGSPLTAALVPGAGPVCVSGTSLFMLTAEGDLITPTFEQGQTSTFCSTTTPMSVTLQVPAAGPGSSGSFVAYHQHPPGLAARLDVGAASPSFPSIHTFPDGIQRGYASHAPWYFPSTWRFVNTSATAFTFAPGDVARVFTPGGTTPVLVFPLAGIVVPAGGRAGIPLLNTLTPAQYTVDVQWIDPAVGPVARRHGVQAPVGSDLHLPGGHTIPTGGSLTARMQFGNLVGINVTVSALLVGFMPGSTPLTGTTVVPLVPDALVIASLTGGLSPFLSNSPAPPIAVPGPACSGYCFPGLNSYAGSTVVMTHPGPALSGTVVRVCGFLANPAIGLFLSTQGEEILIQ